MDLGDSGKTAGTSSNQPRQLTCTKLVIVWQVLLHIVVIGTLAITLERGLPFQPNQVSSGDLLSGAVTTEKISSSAITEDKLADSSVSLAKLSSEVREFEYTDPHTLLFGVFVIVGNDLSMTIGSDGLPILAYVDLNFPRLFFMKCFIHDCSSSSGFVFNISSVEVGVRAAYTSIKISSDGLPLVAYSHQDNKELYVLQCTSADCSTTAPPALVDANRSGTSCDMVIGTDGFPLITYYDDDLGNLMVVHCTNTVCSTFETPVALDTVGDVGSSPSIVIGQLGFGVISYSDATNGNLKVGMCLDTRCSTFQSATAVVIGVDVAASSSMTIGGEGFPVIAYVDVGGSDELRFVSCTAHDCSSSNAPVTLDASSSGSSTSIALDPFGFPVVSYGPRRFVRCTSVDCSSVSYGRIEIGGKHGHILLFGVDGLPIIANYNPDFDALNIVHCTNVNCFNQRRLLKKIIL